MPRCFSRELCHVTGAPSKRMREAGDAAPMELEGNAVESIPAPATKALKAAGDARGTAPGAPDSANALPAAQEGDCLVYVSALKLSLAQCAFQGCRAGCSILPSAGSYHAIGACELPAALRNTISSTSCKQHST